MHCRSIGFGTCLSALILGYIFFVGPQSVSAKQQVQPAAAQPANIATYKTLTPRILKMLTDEVAVSLNAGNNIYFMNSMLEVLQRTKVEQHADILQFGFDQNLGSLRDKFGSQIRNRVEQNLPAPLPQLTYPATVFISDHFVEFVESELEDLNDHRVMQEPLMLPKAWLDREKVFWEVHVFKNRLLNIERLSEFLIQMNMRHFKIATRQSDNEKLEHFEPIDEMPQQIIDHRNGMLENEAMLRLKQLRESERALRTEGTTFKDRLSAAFAMDLDKTALEEFFANVNPDDVTRIDLLTDETKTEIVALLDSAAHNGKDVIEKALLLRHGAHWWLRGRYGMGPMAWGLLKRRDAMDSEKNMFGLYMPKERSKPVNWMTRDNVITPGYERRHYFTWAIEKREISGAPVGVEIDSNVTYGTKGPVEPNGNGYFF